MLRDIFSLAFIQVKKRPLRAILTVLQVTLGIATIAVIFNIVFGLWDGIKATEENMGGNVYMLQVGQQSTSSDGRSTHTYMRGDTFTIESIQELQERVDTIEYVSPMDYGYDRLINVKEIFYRVRRIAYIGPDFLKVVNMDITRGSFFTKGDYEQGANVCVISTITANMLFGDKDPVGENVQLYSSWYGASGELPAPTEYTIIGVFDPGPLKIGFGQLTDYQMLLPNSVRGSNYTTDGITVVGGYTSTVGDISVGSVLIRIKPRQFGPTQAALSSIVRAEYGDDMDAILSPMDSSIQEFSKIMVYLSGIMGGFGLLIVVISSIGILSTMMVNTLERTRQIGIEKALGASRGLITLKLNIEAVLMSFTGGLLGLVVAYIVTEYIGELISVLPISLERGLHPMAIFMSLFVAIVSGWLFGLIPAIQGSKLSPTEALRQR